MGTGCGLKIRSKIELSCRLNLSWPCRSALFTNYGHVFVVTQSPTSESSLPLSRPTLPSPTCYLHMHASATDNMELPPGSPQLDVPAARLHGRGSCIRIYLPAPYFLKAPPPPVGSVVEVNFTADMAAEASQARNPRVCHRRMRRRRGHDAPKSRRRSDECFP